MYLEATTPLPKMNLPLPASMASLFREATCAVRNVFMHGAFNQGAGTQVCRHLILHVAKQQLLESIEIQRWNLHWQMAWECSN